MRSNDVSDPYFYSWVRIDPTLFTNDDLDVAKSVILQGKDPEADPGY